MTHFPTTTLHRPRSAAQQQACKVNLLFAVQVALALQRVARDSRRRFFAGHPKCKQVRLSSGGQGPAYLTRRVATVVRTRGFEPFIDRLILLDGLSNLLRRE